MWCRQYQYMDGFAWNFAPGVVSPTKSTVAYFVSIRSGVSILWRVECWLSHRNEMSPLTNGLNCAVQPVTVHYCNYNALVVDWQGLRAFVAGALGVVWSILWFFLISDTPAKHPRIDPREREYIEGSQGLLAASKVSRLPFTSPYFVY